MKEPVSPARMQRVLTDLQAWTDRLWANADENGYLNDFLSRNNFDDYWKYYKELMPFVRDFATAAGNEEISRLANEFCKENFLKIERELNANERGAVTIWSSLFGNGKGMSDFREMFHATKNTLDNLVYQLKIY